MIDIDVSKLPPIGKSTECESELISHMGNCMADYLEKNPSD